MRIILFILFYFLFLTYGFAQNYNKEQTKLRNFLVRMYQNSPFEGVKIVSDYENDYLLSVVLIPASNSKRAMNRIAQIKNARQVSQFSSDLTSIKSQTIISIGKDSVSSKKVMEVTDIIQENSIGYAQSMEVLTTLNVGNKERCYMFIRKIDDTMK